MSQLPIAYDWKEEEPMTLGEIAQRAFEAHFRADSGFGAAGTVCTWEELPERSRACWEAAGRAVMKDGAKSIRHAVYEEAASARLATLERKVEGLERGQRIITYANPHRCSYCGAPDGDIHAGDCKRPRKLFVHDEENPIPDATVNP